MRTQGHGAPSPQPVGTSGQLGKEQTLPCADDLFSRYGVGLGQPFVETVLGWVSICAVPAVTPYAYFVHGRLPGPASPCLSLDRARSVVSDGVLSPLELGWNHPGDFHMLYYPLG